MTEATNSHRPGFFILGAPKCGTSTLYEMLRSNPSLYLPESKIEPHFFAPDIALHKRHPTLESYLSLFAKAPPNTLIGEASTWYLYSCVAIDRILEFDPGAKCIMLLRNPVNMAQSMHAFNLVKRHENEADFETAWSLMETRRIGRNLPPHVVDPAFVQYFDACALAGAVERACARVPKEQLLILIYEEFFADPAVGLAQVCRFLGVPPHQVKDVPRANPNRAWRYPKLAELFIHPPGALRALYGPAKHAANSLGLRPAQMLNLLNTSYAPRATLRPEFRAQLQEAFAENNTRMREILDQPLEAWRR